MMLRHHPPVKVTATIVALTAVWPVGDALAQVRVIIADGEVMIDQDEPAVAMAPVVLPPDAADSAIGDPWWDDVAAPAPAGAANDGPPPVRNIAQQRLAAQRRGQSMEVLRRELSLVRATCPELEPEARATILAAGRAAAEDRAVIGGQTVEAAVHRAVQAVADGPEAAAHRREVSARGHRRRAAAAAVLVEAIDRDVLFDGGTRRELATALEAAWSPAWDQLAALAGRQRLSGGRLPAGVEGVVASVLDAKSYAAWRERRAPIKP